MEQILKLENNYNECYKLHNTLNIICETANNHGINLDNVDDDIMNSLIKCDDYFMTFNENTKQNPLTDKEKGLLTAIDTMEACICRYTGDDRALLTSFYSSKLYQIVVFYLRKKSSSVGIQDLFNIRNQINECLKAKIDIMKENNVR